MNNKLWRNSHVADIIKRKQKGIMEENPRRRSSECDVMEQKAGNRLDGRNCGEMMQEKSWMRDHREQIIEEKPWRRNTRGETIEEK